MTFKCEWCRYTYQANYNKKWNIKIQIGRGIMECCPNCMRVKPQWRIK